IPECVEGGHYAPYRGLSVGSRHNAVNGAFRDRVWQDEIVNTRLWPPREIDFGSRCRILCPGVKPLRVRRISRCRLVKVDTEMVFARPKNTELITPIRIGHHASITGLVVGGPKLHLNARCGRSGSGRHASCNPENAEEVHIEATFAVQ